MHLLRFALQYRTVHGISLINGEGITTQRFFALTSYMICFRNLYGSQGVSNLASLFSFFVGEPRRTHFTATYLLNVTSLVVFCRGIVARGLLIHGRSSAALDCWLFVDRPSALVGRESKECVCDLFTARFCGPRKRSKD